MKDEINKIINLEEQYKLLNNDYNNLKIYYKKENIENAEQIQKNKNNEKLIAELQGEITKLKNENYEKNNKIIEFEKEQKKYESKIISNTEQINKIISEKSDIDMQCTELNKKNVRRNNIQT